MIELLKKRGITLKRAGKIIFFFIVFIFITGLFFNIFDLEENKDQKEHDILLEESRSKINKTSLYNAEQSISIPNEGVYTYIGKSGHEIEKLLGKPNRVDESSYDYQWWIYNSNLKQYLQVGILNNKVVTAFAIGEATNTKPFKIGQTLYDIYSSFSINSTISLNVNQNAYRFELTEEELNVSPLLSIGDVYLQLYFDKFTQKLSSIRFMDGETLIKIRPYELIYRGELITSDDISSEKWLEIEKGSALEVLDITNVIRQRHMLPSVEWDDKTASVAYRHSKDMFENQYFSHDSPTFGDLADRLSKGEVSYKIAGENIAAKYIDGIAAVEGWLNSVDHRKTLLNGEFTHLGVGVYHKYYTQNFIKPWE